MADVRVASTGDALPLLDPDGSSNYIVGRNNATDIRASLLTLLASPIGSSFTARPGVYARSYNSGSVGSLKVIQNTSADRWVQVQAGISLHTRTSSPYLAYWPATILIQATAANLTNPRIDLVVARLYDKGAIPADPLHGPYIEIIEGTAAASPTAPAVPDGAVALAELARDAGSAGDTITTAKITDRRKAAHLPGTPRLLMAGDLASDVGYVPGEQRVRVVGGVTLPPEYWGTDSQWHGTATAALDTTTFDTLSSTVSKVVASVSVPDPGYPYRIRARGALIWTQGINTTFDLGIRQTSAGGTNWGQAVGFANGGGGLAPDIFRQVQGNSGSTALTGATTVCLCLIRTGGSDAGSGANAQSSATYNRFSVDVIPA